MFYQRQLRFSRNYDDSKTLALGESKHPIRLCFQGPPSGILNMADLIKQD